MSLPAGGGESGQEKGAAIVGLRIDVCTYQGFRQGVPRLLDALAKRKIRATFFPAMGPDRSGRAVLRFFRKKGFLTKMLRTGAARMYGVRTALYGTLLPAPMMAQRCAEILRGALTEGHEVGVHSWDHVRWQDHLDDLSEQVIREDYELAGAAFEAAVGRRPQCTAAPAWLSSESSLVAGEKLGFTYGSDMRGTCPFRPVVEGRVLDLPQVPVTLPTLDEVLGRDGQTVADFHRQVLRDLKPGAVSVHTAHAEAEGRAYLGAFEDLLDRAGAGGWTFVPLGDLLRGRQAAAPLPACRVERGFVAGRAGAVSVQGRPVGEEHRR